MFQSVYFSRNGEDAYHYFLRDDKGGINKFQYRPTVYKLDEYGEHTTLFGDKCSPISGKYDWKDPTILEKDIDKELVLLRDLYYETDDTPEYHNLVYLDIEIEILGALTPHSIKAAEAEITAIALIDATTKEKICFILDKKQNISEVNTDGKIVIPCVDENTLLRKFLNKWEQMDPTICVGFNSNFFDMPYLYYRIKKRLGDEVYRLSPIGKVDENPYNPENPIRIGLVNCLDFMLLFKKYITKEEPSYKLADIGTKYAKLGKIEYNGSLDKLFRDDVNKFIDYNIRDVEILEALEDKLKFIELTILISHLCHTPYESIFYNTTLNEGAILTYLKRKNIVAPNKPTTINPSIRELEAGDHVVNQRGTHTVEGYVQNINRDQVIIKTMGGSMVNRPLKTVKKKEGYAGGFLLDIKPSLYNWLTDYDYSSLYPSIIRSLNLSIETLVGRIKIPNQNYNTWCSLVELEEMDPELSIIIEKLNKTTYKITEGKTKVKHLLDIIKSNNLIVSANGTIYDSSKRSVVAEILAHWFNMRKQYKKTMQESYKNGDKANGDLYHLKQNSLKTLLNAVYGGFAINSFRFTDGYKILSSSITTTGQRFIKETIKYANEMIDETYFNCEYNYHVLVKLIEKEKINTIKLFSVE
jgi:DNA polymerase elongation subunit (family B)